MALDPTLISSLDADLQQGVFDIDSVNRADLAYLFDELGLPHQISITDSTGNGWVHPDDSTAQFNGTLASEILGLNQISIHLEFDQPASELDFQMILTLPDDWTFAVSFPLLVDSLFEEINLDSSVPTDPALVVATAEFVDPTRNSTAFSAGLSFYGTISETSPGFSEIGWIATVPTLVTGPIQYSVPQQLLTFSLAYAEVQIPSLFDTSSGSIGISLATNLYRGLTPVLGYYQAGLQMLGTLDFAGEDIQLSYVATGGPIGIAYLSVSGSALQIPSLEDMADYFGMGEEAVAQLPEQFRSTALLSITGMSFGISTSNLSLVSSQVELTPLPLTLPWVIYDPFEIDRLDFTFQALNPFAESRSFSFWVTGEISYGGLQMVVTAELPGLRFTGELKPGTEADLVPFVTELFGTGASLPDHLTISRLGFALDIPNSTYSFDLTIFGDWLIPLGEDEGYWFEFTELTLSALYESDGVSGQLDGKFRLNDAIFDIGFELSPTNAQIYALWNQDIDGTLFPGVENGDAGQIGYQDFAFTGGIFGMSNLPESLDLNLVSAGFSFDVIQKTLTLDATSLNYGSAVLAIGLNEDKKWGLLFGIEVPLDVSIDLSAIDILGILPAQDEALSLDDLHFVAANSNLPAQAFTTRQLETIGDTPGSGLSISLDLTVGATDHYNFGVRFGGKDDGTSTDTSPNPDFSPPDLPTPPTDANDLPATVDPAPESSGQPVQRSFGPLGFNNLGFGIGPDSELIVKLDATISLSGLTIDLIGLQGSFLPESPYTIGFDISGFGATFEAEGIELSASLLKTTQMINDVEVASYTGEALIKLETFSISALGSWAMDDGHPSLMVFAMLNMPLGGVPAFFVTGLAGGFGYNRDLQLPDINSLSSYPLVGGARGTVSDEGQVLQDLNQYMAPLVGNYWMAFGIQWTTYEILQAYGLATASFGVHFEFSVMGLASLAMPPDIEGDPIPPIAEVEMALLVDLNPTDGFFSASAQLTSNSYILTHQAQLTGGFAFCFWFGHNPNAWDFVVTLGGYHPQFDAPSHYPQNVPQVGFNWKFSKHISFKGGVYFALTPSVVMAGGNLHGAFDFGSAQAWFDADANFLIQYQPFHYDVTMDVDVGASYTLDLWLTSKTITITSSVDLHLWGPEFAGTATLDIKVMKLHFDFGAAAASTPDDLTWNQFIESFFPPLLSGSGPAVIGGSTVTNSLINSQVTDGLVSMIDDNQGAETNWTLDPGGATISVTLLLPISDSDELKLNEVSVSTGANGDVDPGPTGLSLSSSTIEVTLLRDQTEDNSSFTLTPVLGKSPKALWSDAGPGLDADALIDGTLTGFELTANRNQVDETNEIDLANLAFDGANQIHFAWANPTVVTRSSNSLADVSGMTSSTTNLARNSVVAALNSQGLDLNADTDPADFAANADNLLLADPVAASLGSELTE